MVSPRDEGRLRRGLTNLFRRDFVNLSRNNPWRLEKEAKIVRLGKGRMARYDLRSSIGRVLVGVPAATAGGGNPYC